MRVSTDAVGGRRVGSEISSANDLRDSDPCAATLVRALSISKTVVLSELLEARLIGRSIWRIVNLDGKRLGQPDLVGFIEPTGSTWEVSGPIVGTARIPFASLEEGFTWFAELPSPSTA